MGASGTTTIDFGAYPGEGSALATVTGQTNIAASSLVEAWIFPAATADHSADEHWVDPPVVMAGNVVAGTGFTIYGRGRADSPVKDLIVAQRPENFTDVWRITTNVPYGLWSVAWVWT